MSVVYSSTDRPTTDELVELYTSVKWTAYTDNPDALSFAIENSTFVIVARLEGQLVGLARCLSDDVSIVYLQDILVHPSFRERGIATELLQMCLERFDHVRQSVLLTDDEPHQHRLYRSAGYSDVATLKHVPLHAFVSIKGIELS